MTKISYDSISGSISTHSKIEELSGRDKCMLFSRLLDELGITAAMYDPKGQMLSFNAAHKEAISKHW